MNKAFSNRSQQRRRVTPRRQHQKQVNRGDTHDPQERTTRNNKIDNQENNFEDYQFEAELNIKKSEQYLLDPGYTRVGKYKGARLTDRVKASHFGPTPERRQHFVSESILRLNPPMADKVHIIATEFSVEDKTIDETISELVDSDSTDMSDNEGNNSGNVRPDLSSILSSKTCDMGGTCKCPDEESCTCKGRNSLIIQQQDEEENARGHETITVQQETQQILTEEQLIEDRETQELIKRATELNMANLPLATPDLSDLLDTRDALPKSGTPYESMIHVRSQAEATELTKILTQNLNAINLLTDKLSAFEMIPKNVENLTDSFASVAAQVNENMVAISQVVGQNLRILEDIGQLKIQMDSIAKVLSVKPRPSCETQPTRSEARKRQILTFNNLIERAKENLMTLPHGQDIYQILPIAYKKDNDLDFLKFLNSYGLTTSPQNAKTLYDMKCDDINSLNKVYDIIMGLKVLKPPMDPKTGTIQKQPQAGGSSSTFADWF